MCGIQTDLKSENRALQKLDGYFSVWQHGKCMDIDRRRVPDTYQCEECSPRLLKFSKTQAREMQLKVLARQRREKEKKRRQRAKGHFKKKIREKSVGLKGIVGLLILMKLQFVRIW